MTAAAPAPAAVPDPGTEHRVVAAARALAVDLAADATRLEREGVTRAEVQQMGDGGLLAVTGPPELGGVTKPAQREVSEALAGASPDAWFVWFQHGPVVKMLSASDNEPLKDRYLAGLCSGQLQGGVAWSNLRTAKPSVLATRTDGGWSLSGFQPWCTGWPMIDVVLVGGLDREHGEVVFGVVPADSPGLVSAGLLDLAAMGGTSTHAVRYEGLHLPEEAVVLRAEYDGWAQVDSTANQNVQPSTFGIALAALDLLAERAQPAADALRERVLDVRQRAYSLIDDVDPREGGDGRLALRAQALLLALECCTALLASRGGRGMSMDDPSQRLLRAAAFQLVHSQAEHIRQATLAQLAGQVVA